MEGKTTKQQYAAPQLEIVVFETEDIMTNSNNQTDIIPTKPEAAQTRSGW